MVEPSNATLKEASERTELLVAQYKSQGGG